ncbi:MAG: response regulator [Candidatus Brocadia sp.]|uniref:Chemotaxis protein CheY n=1 Tax=Candidatus Brocadia fulgida TaxID=380242 RepID=A0A0M2UVR4_9BACT|nr:MAG: chemotaxis protein CheY [Candidatus Brocadia fulgida]MCC6325128.1 response regulator [Candidatus Brocadia sp.]MCE7910466.1 response regulator [Candidatus Brocadia sp. AMX3]OQY97361.1 MAG: two-component system response regulator [Candidatus Brocadia sp. UTAMX2]MBV6519468.1 Chemotaxis protein CheY [Candidatus Brocadia fulgida]
MPKVLIIDDSAVMRKIIQRNIQQSGLLVDEFVEAGDGREGLEKAASNSIDLILCDWNMPNMTGIDFVKALRGSAQKNNIPIVMVTTEGGETKIEEAKRSGANGYLTKPFTPEQLKSKLGNFLLVK